jgi:type II secretory pathway component PulF
VNTQVFHRASVSRWNIARFLSNALLSVADRLLSDRLFWTKRRFLSSRAEYYGNLASRMEKMKGVPYTEFFAKDAARYPKEPVGKLSAYWLARHEGLDGESQVATMANALRGTVPDEDIGFLAVAEKGGDLKQGLYSLSENLTILDEVRGDIVMVLISVIFSIVVLHVYFGIVAVLVAPTLVDTLSGSLTPDLYGPKAKMFFGVMAFVRHWGWAVLIAEIGAIVLVMRSLTRYTGRFRPVLDEHFIVYGFFREFQSVQFLAGLAGVSQRYGGEQRHMTAALELLQEDAYPWLRWHIVRILNNLDSGVRSMGDVLDTGLFAKKTMHWIQDVAEHEPQLPALMKKASDKIMETAPKKFRKQARRITLAMTFGLILIITALVYTPTFVVHEMSGQIELYHAAGR